MAASRSDATIDQAALEAYLDHVPRALAATWCGVDSQAFGRLAQRCGVDARRTVDIREMLTAMARQLRQRQADRRGPLPPKDGSGGEGDDENLVTAKLREEIRSLRKRREWVDARIKLIRQQYVPIAAIQGRLKKLTAALLRAGEQLGQRHGAEAQESFNAALEGAMHALAGDDLRPAVPPDDELIPKKKRRRPRKRKK